MAVPNYCGTPALHYLKKLLKEPLKVHSAKTDKTSYSHYEEDVGSWTITLLKKVFSDDKWILTPQNRDVYTGKKPDLIVEKFEQDTKVPILLMGLKGSEGGRLEDALHQTCENLYEWVDNANLGVYIIVQRGTKIAFFEFHSNTEDVAMVARSVFGCTSLTIFLYR